MLQKDVDTLKKLRRYGFPQLLVNETHCNINTKEIHKKILATRTISYSLNLLDHITDHDFTYIPWYNLSSWENEKEKNQNVQNENDNNIHANYEIFTIDRNSSNQQCIIHNFKVDY